MLARPRSWTDEQFAEAVGRSRTIAEALKRLGLVPRGQNYRTFRRHCERLKLDTGHFLGKAHLAGQNRHNLSTRIPLAEILVENSTYENTPRLGERLVREGVLTERCYECGLTEWRGQKLRFRLDHINGKNRDHRRENLRFLCPNCDSLTDTYCGRNSAGERLTRRQRERRQMDREGVSGPGELWNRLPRSNLEADASGVEPVDRS